MAFHLHTSKMQNRNGNVESGFRFGCLGLRIFEQFSMQQWTGRVYSLFYGFLHDLKLPTRESIEPLKYACTISLEKGDVEYGLLCGNLSIFSQMQIVPLKKLHDEVQAQIRKLSIYGQRHSHEMLQSLNVTIHNLLWNANPDVDCLSGELLNENEYNDIKSSSYNSLGWSHVLRMWLYYLFGHYDKAYKHSQVCIISEVVGINSDGVNLPFVLLFIGLANIEYARSRRKSTSTVVKKCVQRLQDFARYAPLNCLGKKFLLEAELVSLKKKNNDVAFEKYTCAIALSKDADFGMETALGYERAAKYLLRRGDYNRSSTFFNEAITLYRKWGSEPKVKHLIGEIKNYDCIKIHVV